MARYTIFAVHTTADAQEIAAGIVLDEPLAFTVRTGQSGFVSRIQRAFERRFRELLAEFGARDREKGVRHIFLQAERLAERTGQSLVHGLAEQNISLAEKMHRFRKRVRRDAHDRDECVVFCDAGLGGLARWLRAVGCDAHWIQDISDAQLVEQALRIDAILVTTDSLLLDRRPIARGELRALWVPPALTRFEQLRLVRAELDLPENHSRCMRCGGELLEVNKEAVKERIPPKTYCWVDRYFECARCGQLFWEGTHWQRVTKKLKECISMTDDSFASRPRDS